MDNIDNLKEVACLSQAVHGEAGNQSMEGKIAVAYVIINRTKSSNFPDDVCAVVRQRGQFDFLKKVTWIKEDKPGVKKQMEESIKASLVAWQGDRADPTHGSLYFVNPKLATDKNWLVHYKVTARIGDHAFYRPRRSDM
jgi:N-acetylmuramoyl-L-alanine amidase